MSSYTLTQFATQAARDLGCLRAGQALSADVIADILTAANEMLDAWLIDELMIPASPAQIFNLTAGLQQYTIGPAEVAPNFPAARITQIEDANIILNTVIPNLRTPLEVINVDQWADIRVQQLPNALPLRLYYVKDFNITTGAGTILIWPGPLYSYQLELFAWDQTVLRAFPDAATPFIYPPAYARLIRKNLAVEIAPLMTMYSKAARTLNVLAPSQQMLTLVMGQAREAKEAVQSYNAPDPMLVGDPAYCGGNGRNGFNWLLGTPGTGRGGGR